METLVDEFPQLISSSYCQVAIRFCVRSAIPGLSLPPQSIAITFCLVCMPPKFSLLNTGLIRPFSPQGEHRFLLVCRERPRLPGRASLARVLPYSLCPSLLPCISLMLPEPAVLYLMPPLAIPLFKKVFTFILPNQMVP